MLQTLEAVVDERGQVRLAQPVQLPPGRRALVIILDEPAASPSETALLNEQALADNWDRPEEDKAWSHLASSVAIVRFPFSDWSNPTLYASYSGWCEENGVRARGMRGLTRSLKARGLRAGKTRWDGGRGKALRGCVGVRFK